MAYTKYSATAASNTTTPPNGAPTGMNPGKVDDVLRDVMAEIRMLGDRTFMVRQSSFC